MIMRYAITSQQNIALKIDTRKTHSQGLASWSDWKGEDIRGERRLAILSANVKLIYHVKKKLYDYNLTLIYVYSRTTNMICAVSEGNRDANDLELLREHPQC